MSVAGAAPAPEPVLGSTAVPGLSWAANFFPKEVVGHWHSLSSAVVESPSLEMLKKHMDGGWGLMVNMELMILEGFSTPDDSMILLFSIPLCSAPSLDSCLV